MSYADDLEKEHKSSHSRINNEYITKEKKKMDTDQYRNFDKYIKSDEQKRADRHSEGYCYGCSKYDNIMQNLWYVCGGCYQKRGKEGVINIQCKKFSHELCDLCGLYQMYVSQLNISLCDRCRYKVSLIWRKYSKNGGHEGTHPLNVALKKHFGKDWKKLKETHDD